MSAAQAQQDIGRFLMQRYNWERPHQFNGGLPPAIAEENLIRCPGLVDHYNGGQPVLFGSQAIFFWIKTSRKMDAKGKAVCQFLGV